MYQLKKKEEPQCIYTSICTRLKTRKRSPCCSQYGERAVHLYVLFCTHIIYISKKFTSSKQNSTLLGHTSLSSKVAVNPSISQKYFGNLQPRPTTEESPAPPEMPFQVPPLLPSLPGPLVFPEQASSHRLSFAQQALGPGCPFLPSLVKPSASFKSSSAPSIPACPQPPWAAMSLSPHRPLRKHHSPCLSRPR